MTIEDRRKFFRGAGLLGLIVSGAASAKMTESLPAVVNNHTHIHNNLPEVDPKVVAQIEEMNPSTLTLQQIYGDIEPPKPPPPLEFQPNNYVINNGGTYTTAAAALTIASDGNVQVGLNKKKFIPGTEKHVDVKLVPGPDGELYLNINGQWKKILTTA